MQRQNLRRAIRVSRELLADAENIAEALRLAIALSFARELDRVGLLGTGTAPEPRGVLNTAGIQSVTNGANGAALASDRKQNVPPVRESKPIAPVGFETWDCMVTVTGAAVAIGLTAGIPFASCTPYLHTGGCRKVYSFQPETERSHLLR